MIQLFNYLIVYNEQQQNVSATNNNTAAGLSVHIEREICFLHIYASNSAGTSNKTKVLISDCGDVKVYLKQILPAVGVAVFVAATVTLGVLVLYCVVRKKKGQKPTDQNKAGHGECERGRSCDGLASSVSPEFELSSAANSGSSLEPPPAARDDE